VVASLALVTAAGALLSAASLALHLHAYQAAVNSLSPGTAGSVLLLLAGLAYLPNSIVWAVSYMLGPGFTFGVGTAVSPNGSALGAIPAFPMLAGLPVGSRAAFPMWLGFLILVTPYVAGVLAGLMTVRIAPTPFLEAAPLWGMLTGSLSGLVIGVLAKFSGGPLGAGHLGSVGPAGAEVGVVAVLEIGVTAALVAGAANWLLLRHHVKRLAQAGEGVAGARADSQPVTVGAGAAGTRVSGPLPAVIDERDDAGGHRIYIDPWASERDEPDPEA
jgi:hypothetical protein